MPVPKRSEVEAFQKSIRIVASAAQHDVKTVFTSLDWSEPGEAVARLKAASQEILPVYSNATVAMAAEWVEELTGLTAVLPETMAAEHLAKRFDWATAKAFDGNVQQALETTLQVVDHLVTGPGKKTVSETCAAHGVRFARVPSGATTCEFCLMLASRGFVYASAEAAGRVDRFHASCDCVIVPEDGVIPDGYDPDALYEKWEKRREIGELNEVLAERGLPKITEKVERHILDGEPYDLKRGGHRYGTGRVTKTEFPKEWTDEQAVIAVIHVLMAPAYVEDRGQKVKRRAIINGVAVEVDADKRGNGKERFRSAFPRGGDGVLRNQIDKSTGNLVKVPVGVPHRFLEA